MSKVTANQAKIEFELKEEIRVSPFESFSLPRLSLSLYLSVLRNNILSRLLRNKRSRWKYKSFHLSGEIQAHATTSQMTSSLQHLRKRTECLGDFKGRDERKPEK